jgi:hypothetical protein
MGGFTRGCGRRGAGAGRGTVRPPGPRRRAPTLLLLWCWTLCRERDALQRGETTCWVRCCVELRPSSSGEKCKQRRQSRLVTVRSSCVPAKTGCAAAAAPPCGCAALRLRRPAAAPPYSPTNTPTVRQRRGRADFPQPGFTSRHVAPAFCTTMAGGSRRKSCGAPRSRRHRIQCRHLIHRRRRTNRPLPCHRKRRGSPWSCR